MKNMSFDLYVMVSVPEAKMENVLSSPTILGVFDSKESAQKAWKQRTDEFKDIKAKTVHTYYEVLSTEKTVLPTHVYLWATYTVYGFSRDETPNFEFTPLANGFFETYDDYQVKKEWLKQQKTISARTFCEESDFIFYSSNENIVEKCEINQLVRIPVELTDTIPTDRL